jgi:4-amino-4-deoxy-L-arabinose transferase-like glycosyltransferase
MSVNKDLILNFKPYKYIWIFLIVALIAAPIFLHLDSKPLREWDEARNAINAFEMSQTGNFLVKTYNYQADLWETKPPLLVWLQAIGFKLFGYNELAVRLPSAIATFGICIFMVFWFYKNFKLSIIGIFAAFIIVSSWGYMHEHASRTGDHDALLICFTILALFNIFQYFETNQSEYLYKFFILFTLAVFTKSIVVLLIVPGILIYSIYQKQAINTIKNSRFWYGLSFSIIVIAGFYISREIADPGYLKAVWHNELFPRYLNKSDRYQYSQTDFWFYYRELKDWQFKYWFPFIIPSFIISIFCYQNALKNLAIFISIQIVMFYIIISNGSSNVWYDLLLIPLCSIIIAMAIYKLFELIYSAIKMNRLKSASIFMLLFSYIFFEPYQDIIKKTLNNDENSSQVMYAYAFKRMENTKPKLKTFSIYEPLGYNYPLVFYKNIYKQTKGYKITNINESELVGFKGYLLILKEQFQTFDKHQLQYKIILNDPFYSLIEL